MTMKFLNRSGKIILGCIAVIVVAGPLFWIAGGVQWLDAKVFPPTRPGFMPVNSVWIEAPHLPISWHHGWWFGCGLSFSGAANYCRLVEADGQQVYGGEYLPCSGSSPIGEASVRLVTPPDSADMWLFGEETDGVNRISCRSRRATALVGQRKMQSGESTIAPSRSLAPPRCGLRR